MREVLAAPAAVVHAVVGLCREQQPRRAAVAVAIYVVFCSGVAAMWCAAHFIQCDGLSYLQMRVRIRMFLVVCLCLSSVGDETCVRVVAV